MLPAGCSRPGRYLRFSQVVCVVGAKARERLVRGAMEIRRTGRNEVELLAELETVRGLRLRVRRVEGLDAVQPDVALEAGDQVPHLAGLGDVPVGMRDDGHAAGR